MKIPKAESKTVEFKSTFNHDVIVVLVAFANADGGDVYVGVRDDGKIIGVQLAKESETTWINEIKTKTAPAIVPEADRIVVGGKCVVRLHISPLPVKPTSVQGRYYVRKAKSNHLMSLAELSDLYLKAVGDSWDALPNRRDLDAISLEKVAAFANPGGLPHGLTVADLLSDAYVTSPRNPQLASLFKAVGLTERYGSGIKRIENACRKHGGVRVEFENHETWFKVVLLKVDGEKRTGEMSQKKLGEKLGEKRRRIIGMMVQNPFVTTFDLVAGIGISQTAIENNITWLRSHGYIRRVGPDKGGHWEVIEK